MDSSIVKSGRIWDLHIHSNRCSSTPPETKKLGIPEYVDGLLEVFGAHPDLDMISFTDHNSMSVDVYEEFLSRDSGIRLLPGVEVDVQLCAGDPSKHLIVYFDAVDDGDKITALAERLNDILDGIGPKNPINIDALLNKLIDLRIPFLLSPHAMKQKKRGFDYDWHCLDDPGAEARKYVDQFFCFWETGGKSDIAYAVEFLREVDAGERVSVISFSDSKDYDKLEEYLANPPQYFRSLPSFRGLQMVGSDAHRISEKNEALPDAELGSFLGEISFDGQRIELSSRLNTIIGGRGSGKSLLLDGLALALGDSHGRVPSERENYLAGHNIAVKNARGDAVAHDAFAYDYFNQSYIARLFMEEGETRRELLKSYFASGFAAVDDIDENGIKNQITEAFALPVAKTQGGDTENISGLVDKYIVDRNDSLDIRIAKKDKLKLDKKISRLDYGELATAVAVAIRPKIPIVISDDDRYNAALLKFEREVLLVAESYRRDYLCEAFLVNTLIDKFLNLKGEISEAQKAKADAVKLFDAAFTSCSKNTRERVAVVNSYLSCAVNFTTHYEKAAVKDGAKASAFRFKKTFDIEHPLRHMLGLFKGHFLSEKAGKGGFNEGNLEFLFDQFCFDEGGYKKDKDWRSLLEELKKFNLEYVSDVAIEYLCDDGVYRDIATMSPGTQTNILLEYIVHMETARPLLIDQPEDNVDNQTIFNQIRAWFVKLKQEKQVIVVTHDANIVINADAENVVIAQQVSPGVFEYSNGALESGNLIDRASLILDGGRDAVKRRLMKYGE